MLVKAERVQGDNFDKARELVISNSENQRHEEIDISIMKQHRKFKKNTRHGSCKITEFWRNKMNGGDDLEKVLVLVLRSTSVPINGSEEF